MNKYIFFLISQIYLTWQIFEAHFLTVSEHWPAVV